MTIVEAIKEVMRRAQKPLTPSEVYEAVVANGLYDFKAKNPTAIVAAQIRRHCKDIDLPKASGTKHFESRGENRYFYLDTPS
jgi:restriction system protein